MRIFWLSLFLQIWKFTFKGQRVPMAFEDNEIYSGHYLFCHRKSSCWGSKVLPVTFIMIYKEQKTMPAVKIVRIQPDSPALYPGNNHKSKLRLYQKMSDSEVCLSFQVWVQYTCGFEQVSTCQVCFYHEAMVKTAQKDRNPVRTLMLLHTYEQKKIERYVDTT